MVAMKERFENTTIEIETPDGNMFVNILEREAIPCAIHVHIGKSGASISAWSKAMSDMMELVLAKGGSVNEIIQILSENTSHKVAKNYKTGLSVRSAVEGIAIALIQYKELKIAQQQSIFGEHRGPRFRRPPSVGI